MPVQNQRSGGGSWIDFIARAFAVRTRKHRDEDDRAFTKKRYDFAKAKRRRKIAEASRKRNRG